MSWNKIRPSLQLGAGLDSACLIPLYFGSIGEGEQTIAEVVQTMYYEGYDFTHFCSMSIPAMLVEAIVRLGYAVKRIKERHTV